MVGDSTIAFYKQYADAGLTAAKNPIAATVTTEVEVAAMGPKVAKGHFMTATYFQSLNNSNNKKFVAAYKKRWGANAVTHMPLAGTYQSVYLFADAARKLKGDDVYDATKLTNALLSAKIDNAPEGIPIHIYPNHHCNHPVYVGQTNASGQFDIVAKYGARAPDPFPPQIVPAGRAPKCPVPLS
jgi:urea transport system substrate-binding protein